VNESVAFLAGYYFAVTGSEFNPLQSSRIDASIFAFEKAYICG
jgi:hypothetical protein